METDLSRLIDALPGLVWTALSDGQADYINEQWSVYAGMSLAQAVGTGWLSAVHPDDLGHLLDRWSSFVRTGEGGNVEARLRRTDGVYRWFNLAAAPLTDASGQLVKWCGINTDIEDRKRAEETLHQQSEAELQRINSYLEEAQRLSLTGSFTWDVKTDEHFWSAEMFRIFRYDPRSKITTKMILQNILAEDMVNVERAMSEAAAGGNFDVEYRLRMPNGLVKHIHSVGHPIESSTDRPMVIGCLRDITERKVADEQLRRINGYLEEAQRLSLTGSFTWDVRADEHSWSHETFRIFEIEPVAIVDIAMILPRVHPGDMQTAERVIGGAAGGADFQTELRLLMPSGFVKHVDVVGHRIREITDRPVFLGCIRDITERKQSDEKLRRSEALLAEGQRLSSTGSYSWHLDTDEVLFSDELNRIFEFDPASAITLQQIAARIHPDDLAVLAREIEGARTGTGDHRYEIRLKFPNGAIKYVYTVGHRVMHEERPVMIGSIGDITHSKKAEEAIHRTTHYLCAAEALSKTGSGTLDWSKEERHWSDELYRIWEYDLGSPLTLQMVSDRVHPDDMPIFDDFSANSAGKRGLEFRLQMPDGRIKHLRAVTHAFRVRPEALPEGVVAIQDVTEHRQSEQALAKVRSELAHVARVTALGTLTASIAHEVNQPLSGIITNASTCLRMLATDPPNIEGASDTAKRVIRDGNRAAEVITRLRALFAGKTTRTDAVDLSEATREVIALSANELQRSRVVLQAELAEHLPAVAGDRVQLQQVVLNLLMNAIDAMSEIEDRPRHVLVRTEWDEGGVRVAVQDAGVGFSAQNAEHLFEAFHTTKPGGMGIGLSVSRSIVESHGGRLWADRNAGPGSTFAFLIPTRRMQSK